MSPLSPTQKLLELGFRRPLPCLNTFRPRDENSLGYSMAHHSNQQQISYLFISHIFVPILYCIKNGNISLLYFTVPLISGSSRRPTPLSTPQNPSDSASGTRSPRLATPIPDSVLFTEGPPLLFKEGPLALSTEGPQVLLTEGPLVLSTEGPPVLAARSMP